MNVGKVLLNLCEEQSKDWNSFLHTAGLDVPKYPLHVTVMYDASNPDVVMPPIGGIFYARAGEILTMTSREGDVITYLELDSPAIKLLNNTLMHLGMKHSYNLYKCHMTLGKNLDPRLLETLRYMYARSGNRSSLRNLIFDDWVVEPI